jgi:PAS domain S-box-containing protein
MVRNWKAEILQTIAQCFLGSILLGLLTFACFHFGLSLTITAFIYLMAILVLSVRINFAALTVLSFAAAACLVYFFAQPIFNFQIELPTDVAVTGSFLLLAFAVSSLVAGSRSQTKAALQYAAALRRSEAYLEEAQRLAHTGSWAWNVATRENVYWSPEMFRVFDLDPSKDTSSFADAVQRIQPDDAAAFLQAVDIAIREKKDFEVDWRIVLPDGNIRYVHNIGHPIIDKNGEVTEFVGTLVDVTEQRVASEALDRENAERKRAEDELRLSEAYLHEAQRLGRMGSWVVDMSTGAISATPEWFRIFDMNPEKISPTMELFRERVHPDDRVTTEEFMERRRQSKVDVEVAYRIILPDGTVRHLHSVSHPVFGDDGTVIKTLGTTVDETERKRAEQDLRKAQADLTHAARVATLGELTATIAHEVNQPLAGVVSSGNACLRWLASEPPNIENARQSANRIVRDAHRASEVIGRVRSLAKKAPPEKEWLDINEVVLETLGLTRMEAAQNRASLRTRLSDEIQSVWADRIEVQQVILNLIMNAIEAVSEPGNEQRDVLVETARTDSNDVTLSVKDTGTGLDPTKLEHIFDAFYTTKREGMGMGLAVSRSIIEAHGGRLWATPNQPRGAVFQFILPSARDEAS